MIPFWTNVDELRASLIHLIPSHLRPAPGSPDSNLLIALMIWTNAVDHDHDVLERASDLLTEEFDIFAFIRSRSPSSSPAPAPVWPPAIAAVSKLAQSDYAILWRDVSALILAHHARCGLCAPLPTCVSTHATPATAPMPPFEPCPPLHVAERWGAHERMPLMVLRRALTCGDFRAGTFALHLWRRGYQDQVVVDVAKKVVEDANNAENRDIIGLIDAGTVLILSNTHFNIPKPIIAACCPSRVHSDPELLSIVLESIKKTGWESLVSSVAAGRALKLQHHDALVSALVAAPGLTPALGLAGAGYAPAAENCNLDIIEVLLRNSKTSRDGQILGIPHLLVDHPSDHLATLLASSLSNFPPDSPCDQLEQLGRHLMALGQHSNGTVLCVAALTTCSIIPETFARNLVRSTRPEKDGVLGNTSRSTIIRLITASLTSTILATISQSELSANLNAIHSLTICGNSAEAEAALDAYLVVAISLQNEPPYAASFYTTIQRLSVVLIQRTPVPRAGLLLAALARTAGPAYRLSGLAAVAPLVAAASVLPAGGWLRDLCQCVIALGGGAVLDGQPWLTTRLAEIGAIDLLSYLNIQPN